MSILPLLDLRSRRARDSINQTGNIGRSFGDAMLTIDDLRKQQEEMDRKIKQQTFENEQAVGKAERDAQTLAVNERGVKVQEGNLGINQGELGIKQADDAREAEAVRVKGRDAAVSDVVARRRQRSKDGELVALSDLMEDMNQFTYDDVEPAMLEGEWARMEGADAELANKTKLADAAKINAQRPRVASQPKMPGLSAAERETVATTTTQLATLDRIEQDILANRVDPGPLSNIGATLRRAVGLRGTNDDMAIRDLASVINKQMNLAYGAALSEHELSRALKEMPDFKDDNDGFLRMIRAYRAQLAMGADAVTSVAGRDAKVRTGQSTIEKEFPPMATPPTGAGPGPAGAPPPVSRKQQGMQMLKKYMDEGMPLAEAQRRVMTEMIAEMAK